MLVFTFVFRFFLFRRNVYCLVKQFDQHKQTIGALSDVFDAKLELLRTDIVDRSTLLIYQTEYEAIGRKSREILWFKGYYDLISVAKRLWRKNDGNGSSGCDRPEEQMSNLIIEGIAHFKSIIVRLERKFNLDLRNTVDFSFLDTYEKNLYIAEDLSNGSAGGTEQRSSDEVTKYAMETIHALLISLGDLHRYFIDFNFNMPKISKDFAANYYFEAFKLNPKTGMAHNQLGTLLSGSTYDLDSIYHYLYSLVCPVPFELSDINVTKLFQANAKYLERIDSNDKLDAIGVRDFIARYILIVDVFFYDKDVSDFNGLCHCMIVDFRKMLQSKRSLMSSDVLYKVIAILFFCLAKLKAIGSNKVHHLNAFLVAICAEMIAACTTKLEQFIAERGNQNERFQQKYGLRFDEFERNVRAARDNHKRFLQDKDPDAKITIQAKLDNGENKLSFESVESNAKSPPNRCGSQTAGSSGRERDSDTAAAKNSASSEQKIGGGKKKAQHLRRRRKRVSSENSDSDLSYFEDSGSEYDMDTDFSSGDDESVNGNDDSWYSSENEGDDQEDEGTAENGFDGNKLVSGSGSLLELMLIALLFNYSQANDCDDLMKFNENSDSDDVIIESEELIYLNGSKHADETTNGQASVTADEVVNNCDSVFDCFVKNLNKLNLMDDATEVDDDTGTANEPMLYHTNGESWASMSASCDALNGQSGAPEKLRYKQKYNKIDPNIIIEFAEYENSMKALKLLFDWLRINGDILLNCFTTNPEFVDKIFTLLNHLNIDIFTRKVYFERDQIEGDNVRENLRSLFDVRASVPLTEDVLLKEFSVFDQCQHSIDWAMPLKLKISEKEETILRVFKFVDFGFTLCKMKKFKYNFCSRNRTFVQLAGSSGGSNIAGNGMRLNKRNRTRGKREKRRRRNRSRNRGGGGGDRFNGHSEKEFPRLCGDQVSSNDGDEDEERKSGGLKKGYLKNRHNLAISKLQVDLNEKSGAANNGGKHEIMGKLWLQHEIEVLEAKMSKNQVIMTPYLIVDTNALVVHLAIVKNLVKAKKFVVLIPKAGKRRFLCECEFYFELISMF